MTLFLLFFGPASWGQLPTEVPACEPPPKKTITVSCAPDEGCEEKWIFVDKELPIS